MRWNRKKAKFSSYLPQSGKTFLCKLKRATLREFLKDNKAKFLRAKRGKYSLRPNANKPKQKSKWQMRLEEAQRMQEQMQKQQKRR